MKRTTLDDLRSCSEPVPPLRRAWCRLSDYARTIPWRMLAGRFVWALIIGAIVSLLISFNVLDTRNRAVWAIADFFHRLTEPALRPIRRFLPNLGGIDLSPVVLILLLQAGRILLAEIQFGLLGSSLGR